MDIAHVGPFHLGAQGWACAGPEGRQSQGQHDTVKGAFLPHWGWVKGEQGVGGEAMQNDPKLIGAAQGALHGTWHPSTTWEDSRESWV